MEPVFYSPEELKRFAIDNLNDQMNDIDARMAVATPEEKENLRAVKDSMKEHLEKVWEM